MNKYMYLSLIDYIYIYIQRERASNRCRNADRDSSTKLNITSAFGFDNSLLFLGRGLDLACNARVPQKD